MKRGGPLRRLTQLKRKTRLRRISKKRLALKAVTDPERKDFVDQFKCQCCLRRWAEDCHEISRGAARAESLLHRCSWLALCRTCHDAMDDYSEWPPERQLALKMLSDPDYFDIAAVNVLRGRAVTAIQLSDVVVWLKMA